MLIQSFIYIKFSTIIYSNNKTAVNKQFRTWYFECERKNIDNSSFGKNRKRPGICQHNRHRKCCRNQWVLQSKALSCSNRKSIWQRIYMNSKNNTDNCQPLWIDKVNKIISFKEEEGFELIYFSTAKKVIDFTVEQCSNGYRIQ